MRLTSASVVALAMATTPVAAQELTYGSGSLEFHRLTEGGDDLDSTALEGGAEFTVNQFLFGADLTNTTFDDGDEFTIFSANLFAAYAPVPEVLVGASLLSTGTETTSFEEDITGYDLFAQYRTPMFGGAILYVVPDSDDDELNLASFYGAAEVTPGVTLGAIFERYQEAEETAYILSADFEQGPIDARAFYHGVTGADYSVLGVRGDYGISDMFGASASVSIVEDTFADEVTAFTLGGYFEFTDGLVAEASFGRLDADGDDADSFQIAITYEVGDRQRLDSGMRRAASDDRAASIGGFIPEFGFTAIGLAF